VFLYNAKTHINTMILFRKTTYHHAFHCQLPHAKAPLQAVGYRKKFTKIV